MQKTILVPIDFKVTSLNTLRLALEQLPENEVVHIVLMYAEHLGDSITELLFYSPKKRIEVLGNSVFTEALDVLKNRFEYRIASVRFELFHGYNHRAFQSFLEGNQIDLVFIPRNYQLQPAAKGFDPLPLMRKCHCLIQELAWEAQHESFKANQLGLLLH